MGFIWERDEEENKAYVLSLTSPTEKFYVGAAGNYYINGVKTWSAPKDPCVMKLKPTYTSADVIDACNSYHKFRKFEENDQLSFYFMSPQMDLLFPDRKYQPLPRSFGGDLNLRFDFFTLEFLDVQEKKYWSHWEDMNKFIAKLSHSIMANARARNKKEKV